MNILSNDAYRGFQVFLDSSDDELRNSHDRYKLYWLLQHGYGFERLAVAIGEWAAESQRILQEGLYPSIDKVPNFESYLEEQGFHGELWPCLGEYASAEYQDTGLQKTLQAFVNQCRKQSSEDQEGICPICGSYIEYGTREATDEGVLTHWSCPKCEATGLEGANLVFERHYRVRDCAGKPVAGRTD